MPKTYLGMWMVDSLSLLWAGVFIVLVFALIALNERRVAQVKRQDRIEQRRQAVKQVWPRLMIAFLIACTFAAVALHAEDVFIGPCNCTEFWPLWLCELLWVCNI